MPYPTPLGIPAFKDNYIWLISNQERTQAWVVDPGAAQPVIAACKKHNLQLQGILLTHHHQDHQGGVQELLDKVKPANQETNAQEKNNPDLKTATLPVYGPDDGDCKINIAASIEQPIVLFAGELELQVLRVPGHTLDHIAFYAKKPGWLFCGDTLFSAGCGRVFEGSHQQMFDSLEILASLPDNTLIFCTHEYTLANLYFAAKVEANNQDIQKHIKYCQQLRAQDQATLPSNMALEKKINPFLRCRESSVQQAASKHLGKDITNPAEVFSALRTWKDNS